MRVVVLGATGGTGTLVVERALAAGMEVVAYARRSSALDARPGLHVVEGQLSDTTTLAASMAGAEAVICCVGVRPSLGVLRRVDLMHEAMPSIIDAMDAASVARLVLMSAFGVGDTAQKATPAGRVVYRTVLAAVYDDKRRAEEVVAGSALDCTVVYPVALTNHRTHSSAVAVPLREVTKVGVTDRVWRGDVAAILVECVVDQARRSAALVVMSEPAAAHGVKALNARQ